MRIRTKAFRILALFLLFVPGVRASSFDPSKTVVPVREIKVVLLEFATAACLDAQCRYLLSNAHVAAVASPRSIHGDPVVQKYLATGPGDEGAVMNSDQFGARPYNPSRDIAIYELLKPMKGFEGIPFSLERLVTGDEVDIVAFPGRIIGAAKTFPQIDDVAWVIHQRRSEWVPGIPVHGLSNRRKDSSGQ